MRLKHPNVVRCLGAITSPNRIVLDRMQDGEVMDYLRRNPGANRVDLVSFSAFHYGGTSPLNVPKFSGVGHKQRP